MLESLIYISAADPSIKKQDIDNILASALRNNLAEDLSGALIFSGSIFVQILEGPASNLDDMMYRIKADHRHDAVTVMAREEIAYRRFANWSMAYRNVDGLAADELHVQFGWDNTIRCLLDSVRSEQSLSVLSENVAGILKKQAQWASSQF